MKGVRGWDPEKPPARIYVMLVSAGNVPVYSAQISAALPQWSQQQLSKILWHMKDGGYIECVREEGSNAPAWRIKKGSRVPRIPGFTLDSAAPASPAAAPAAAGDDILARVPDLKVRRVFRRATECKAETAGLANSVFALGDLARGNEAGPPPAEPPPPPRAEPARLLNWSAPPAAAVADEAADAAPDAVASEVVPAAVPPAPLPAPAPVPFMGELDIDSMHRRQAVQPRFRCSLSSDGDLMMESSRGGRMELPLDDVRKLFRYLDQMRATDLVAELAGELQP